MYRYLLILTALLLACFPLLAEAEIQPETEELVQNAQGELVPASSLPKNYGPYGVTGRVLDEAGNPVSGAFIFVKSGFQNNMQTRTDDAGRFSITQSHPEPGQVAVIHPNYAPQRFRYSMGKDHAVSDWRVLPETTEPGAVTQGDPPADIILKPAKPSKIRLLDTQGQPIPNATVMWSVWWQFILTEHSPELLPGRTDENGELLWNCAPTGPGAAIQLRIYPEMETDNQSVPKYMRFATPGLRAGEELYEIIVPKPLTITCILTDIITGERITKYSFTAELGPDALARSRPWMPWSNIVEDTTQTRFPDGRFTLTLSSCDYPNRPIRVLISPEGYNAYLSPEIPWDAQDIRIELELAPSRVTFGTILQPDGTTPAANADVLLGNAQTQVRLKDGRVDVNRKLLAGQKSDDPRDLNPRDVRFFHETDENGRFHFPKSSEMEYILVAHATGWACVRLAEHKNDGPVTLQPWGEVKGRVMREGEPVAEVRLQLQMNPLPPGGKPSPVEEKNQCIFLTTTDEAGNFVFSHVMPGTGMLGFPQFRFVLPSSFFTAFSHPQEVRVSAGETVQADMGTAGQNLFGRLEWTAESPNPAPWDRWQARLYRKSDDCIYYANFADDGTFRIPDVPEGEYEFMYGHLSGEQKKFHIHSIITVPPRPETGYGPPRDLGVFRGEEE